ncbi:hypothetical protein ACQJBY_039918 [Aegilops geniculata]
MEGAAEEEGRARCAMEEPQRDWAAARRSHDGGAVAGRNRCRERNGSDGDGEEELPQGSARAQLGRSCRERNGGSGDGEEELPRDPRWRSLASVDSLPPRPFYGDVRPHLGSCHRRHVWPPHGGGRGHSRSCQTMANLVCVSWQMQFSEHGNFQF